MLKYVSSLSRLKCSSCLVQKGRLLFDPHHVKLVAKTHHVYQTKWTIPITSFSTKITQNLFEQLHTPQCDDGLGFVSTRRQDHQQPAKSVSTVLLTGIPNDGGLYSPVNALPTWLESDLYKLSREPDFKKVVVATLEKLLNTEEIDRADLAQIVEDSFGMETSVDHQLVSVVPLGSQRDKFMVEMFHGATGSVYDSSQMLSLRLIQHVLAKQDKKKCLILVPTTGDMGAASVHALATLKEADNMKLIVLYPHERISHFHKAQLESAATDKVKLFGVDANYDFCEAAIKQILADTEFRQELLSNHDVHISTTGSLSWFPTMIQTISHICGYLQLLKQQGAPTGLPIDYCLPAGSFDTVFAAYLAKLMGVPFRTLVLACGKNNNNLAEFINTGSYYTIARNQEVSLSPDQDVSVSANLERYLYMALGSDASAITSLFNGLEEQGQMKVPRQVQCMLPYEFRADWVLDGSILTSINKTYQDTGYITGPSAAIARQIAEVFHDNSEQVPMLIGAPTHYAKGGHSVLEALGRQENHPGLGNDLQHMLSLLQKIDGEPRIHEHLKNSVQENCAQSSQGGVLKANVNALYREIRNFVAV